MKRKIYNSIFTFTLILTSCEDDNNQEKIVRENLEYKEIDTDYVDDESNQDTVLTYYHGKPFSMKYVNTGHELNLEFYFGFEKKFLERVSLDINDGIFNIDSNQELTLKAYRKVEWITSGFVPNDKEKEPIVTKIFEYNNSLGFFMSDEFDKTLKTIKCGDVVTLDELYKNYYKSEEKEIYDFDFSRHDVVTYCTVSFWYELSCDENDYIKCFVSGWKLSDKDCSPFYDADYKLFNKVRFGTYGIKLEIIDDEIVTFWYEDGVKHYY